MIWTPPAPLSSWCGVQNRGLSGSGRHCHVCVASKIWDGVEVDASVKSVWRPESGMEWKWTPLSCLRGVQNWEWSGNGRHCHVDVASKIGSGVEMDARIMSVWRPESGIEWKWTPLPCLRGVQNRGWSGNGRHCHVCVASRIGNGVESGRHCHVGVASRIWYGVEMDAIVMFAWCPESRLKRNRTPPPETVRKSL